MSFSNTIRMGFVALLFCAEALGDEKGTPAQESDAITWPLPTATARPWCRWWWLGSAVDPPNLKRLLTEYHDAGLGGVEICPIYGAKGYENRFVEYLSPQWMEMLSTTVRVAGRLDMGVDMTTGTGWPMGGPWVPAERASESISLRRYRLGLDGRIPDAATLAWSKPGTGAPVSSPIGNTSNEGFPIAEGLPDSSNQGRLLCLRAVAPDDTQVDLTERARQGRLDWSAPGAGWVIYSLMARQPAQRVKRAAPGGAGNVVDPYSIAALDTYLSRFDQAFLTYGGAPPRAQFHDSFEYVGANWTPDFFDQFERRRGYDLRGRLPELRGDRDADSASRVREDYRRTISELHIAYIERWTAWSHAHGSLTREQAHGAPANIEDVYAAADIPETEGSFGGVREDEVPMLKFASSAAHVTGRTLSSSETFTWLGEHFQVSLSQLKASADMFFLSGTNHMVLHGIPYSPADAPWPGWLFYAAVNFGPNGGLWRNLPAFNAYATRCQSILQSGTPDNDVLLYFPVADYWQRNSPEPGTEASGPRAGPDSDRLVLQFTTPGEWMHGSPFYDAAMELWRKGFAFDEVTDALLIQARVQRADGNEPGGGFRIVLGGSRYRAVVLPPCRFMPVETLRHLLELARNGGSIVFSGGLPTDVPGFSTLDARRSELRQLLGTVPAEGHGPNLGAGQVFWGHHGFPENRGDLSKLLNEVGIRREAMTDDGLYCIRRGRAGGHDYFIANTGSRPVKKWVTLARTALSAVILDPLRPERMGDAAVRPGKTGVAIFLQLEPGQSLILRTFDTAATSGAPWKYLRAVRDRSLVLDGEWSVRFIEGGPRLPQDFQESGLGSWTQRDDPEAKRFAGTAVYRLKFTLPPKSHAAPDWRLDLGRVAESARVRLNGQAAATLWCAPMSTDVGAFLRVGENTLEVEVSNISANRIRDLDRRGVDWKRFYEINFVNRDYHPFDASGWPLRDSGLLGPVTLTPMVEIDPDI